MHFSLYSHASPEFTGENNQIIEAMAQVGGAIDNKGIWVIDRGGDRDKLYRSLLQHKRDFIVRLVGSRDFIYQENKARSLWLAFACRSSYKRSFVRFRKGKEIQYNIRYGFVSVQLPDIDGQLNMVVVQGISKKPMIWRVSESSSTPVCKT